jgi:hypothetical protein
MPLIWNKDSNVLQEAFASILPSEPCWWMQLVSPKQTTHYHITENSNLCQLHLKCGSHKPLLV